VFEAPATHYVREGDLALAYQVLGDGPIDLFFVTGGQFPIDLVWEQPRTARFLQRLASFSRLVVFDARAWGASRTTSRPVPTLEEWADDVRAVMDAVGMKRVALVGWFAGAMFSTYFAAAHPGRVSRLVLFEGTARVLRGTDYPVGMTPDALEVGSRVYEEGYGTGDDLSYMAPSLAGDDQFRRWWARCERLANGPAGAGLYWRELAARDLRSVLSSLNVPTLVMHRAGDRFVRVGHGRYLADHIADSTYVELDGEDHLFCAGEIDRPLDEIETFLTGVTGSGETDRVLASVLFTDIVASTDTAVALGDRRWREMLDDHDHLALAQVDRFRGRVIKTTGDGVLATFDGPARAIRCACALRDAARGIGVEVRAGIHTGEVERRDKDIGGVAVHIAARVQATALPNEVIVSRTVSDLVAGSGIAFSDRGEHRLKGIPGEWRLLAVEDPYGQPAQLLVRPEWSQAG
jgi:class 3 adenylate cyclase